MTHLTPPGAARTPRQQQLFDELLAHFLGEGFRDFTVDGAAARLHCSKATIYALAGSREELVRTVVVEFFKRVSRGTEEALRGPGDAEQRLLAYLAAMAEQLRPASPRFLRDVAGSPVASGVYERNTRIASTKLAALVAEGVARGEFRPVPTGFIAEVISSAMERIQQRTGMGGIEGPGAYRELGLLIVGGIRAG
ncbi:TetR/AcrR family transcriptional regulator [Kocuria sp. M1R5S2]|uniref:TetR/AcrR family transcriptional regulator n=1 Tax=Kocuria rhizosphaerae TaxID=3376285 RepID=UPI0037BCD00D